MGSRFISINSEKFEAFLAGLGFERTISNQEIVYTKLHGKEPKLEIKLYTSIRTGADVARDVGQDAIRCVVILHGKEKDYPIFKSERVYRTGSQEKVHARTLERINAAIVRCDEWLAERKQEVHHTTQPRTSEWVGNVGEEIRFTAVVIDRRAWMNMLVFTLEDADRNRYAYWTEQDRLAIGSSYSLRGTVKQHNVYRGMKQTELVNLVGRKA